jgi:DNA gyrase/topoisomerase IV subunit A
MRLKNKESENMSEDQEKRYRVWCFSVTKEYFYDSGSSYQSRDREIVRSSVPNMDFSKYVDVTKGELDAMVNYANYDYHYGKNPRVIFFQDLNAPNDESKSFLEESISFLKKNEEDKKKKEEKEAAKKIAAEKKKIKKEKNLLESLKKKFE